MRGPAELLCTVNDAARELGVHPKTVLRAIRAGRLRARRIGKAYRIRRAELARFADLPEPAETPAAQPWVTSIVDVPDVGPALAQKWARTVTSALRAKGKGPPLRAEVVYEPARAHLKLVLVGAPGAAAKFLELVRVWLEQLEA